MVSGSSRVRTLSDENARMAIVERRRKVPRKLLARDCGTIKIPDSWDPAVVEDACSAVRRLVVKLQEDGVKVDGFNFDRMACSLIHKKMQLPSIVAASGGYWRWLAVERLHDVIEARHHNPAKNPHAHLRNYGIGTRDMGQNRLAILWLRANMLYDDEADNPYHLAERFLHTDFVESAIIRHRFGWCRNLARVLVKFQYRHPATKETYLRNTGSRSIRELYKRLRHLHSVYAFEFMSEHELWSVLEKHSEDLLRA